MDCTRSLWPLVPDRREQRGFLVLSVLFLAWFGTSIIFRYHGGGPDHESVTRCESLPRIDADPAKRIEEIPGVGMERARKIVTYRRRKGPIRSFDELRNISGIGPETVERVRGRARLGPCGSD